MQVHEPVREAEGVAVRRRDGVGVGSGIRDELPERDRERVGASVAVRVGEAVDDDVGIALCGALEVGLCVRLRVPLRDGVGVRLPVRWPVMDGVELRVDETSGLPERVRVDVGVGASEAVRDRELRVTAAARLRDAVSGARRLGDRDAVGVGLAVPGKERVRVSVDESARDRVRGVRLAVPERVGVPVTDGGDGLAVMDHRSVGIPVKVWVPLEVRVSEAEPLSAMLPLAVGVREHVPEGARGRLLLRLSRGVSDDEALRDGPRLRVRVGVGVPQREPDREDVRVAEGVPEGVAEGAAVRRRVRESVRVGEHDAVLRVGLGLGVDVAVDERGDAVAEVGEGDGEEALQVGAEGLAVEAWEDVQVTLGDTDGDARAVRVEDGDAVRESVGEAVAVRAHDPEGVAVEVAMRVAVAGASGVTEFVGLRVGVAVCASEIVRDQPRARVAVAEAVRVRPWDTEAVRDRDALADGVVERRNDTVRVREWVALGLRVGLGASVGLADCEAEVAVRVPEGVPEAPLTEGAELALADWERVRVEEAVLSKGAERLVVSVGVCGRECDHVTEAVEWDRDGDAVGLCVVAVGEGGDQDGVRVPEGRVGVPDVDGVSVPERDADAVGLGGGERDGERVGKGVPVGLGVRPGVGAAVREALRVAERVRVPPAVPVSVESGEGVDVRVRDAPAVAVALRVPEAGWLREAERLEADRVPERETARVQVPVATGVPLGVSVGEPVGQGVREGLAVVGDRLREGDGVLDKECGGEGVSEGPADGDGLMWDDAEDVTAKVAEVDGAGKALAVGVADADAERTAGAVPVGDPLSVGDLEGAEAVAVAHRLREGLPVKDGEHPRGGLVLRDEDGDWVAARNGVADGVDGVCDMDAVRDPVDVAGKE